MASRRSNKLLCTLLILFSLSIFAGTVYISITKLPELKAEHGRSFGRMPQKPAATLAEAARRSKPDLNFPVLIFAVLLTIPALWLPFQFFRPGEPAIIKTMPDSVAKNWDYDQTKTINPFNLTPLERKCVLSIVVAIVASASLLTWSLWYLSVT